MSDTRTEHDFRVDPDHLRRQVDPADLPFAIWRVAPPGGAA